MASDSAATQPVVARVLPDVAGIDTEFDYLVPEPLAPAVRVGSMVRVNLHGRRVGGWVTAYPVDPPEGVTLKPIVKVSGWGPPADVIALARWAAHRWAGRVAAVLTSASPPTMVTKVNVPLVRGYVTLGLGGPPSEFARADGVTVVRIGPGADTLPVVLGARERGKVLVVTPSVAAARLLGARLRRGGASVALYPRDWAQVAAGVDIVVGARAAVWAPMPQLDAIVVLDEHDEALKEERVPCWHARDVAIERARGASVPCVLVSPCPSLEALAAGRLITMSRNDERAAWPIVEVADLSKGVISEALARHIRNGDRIVGVLNRKGKARLLACAVCATLARCERCSAAVGQDDAGNLVCQRCGTVRPAVCLACGASRFKVLRPGVTRVRDELEAMAGEPVVDVTATNDDEMLPTTRIFVGTEAVLHRVAETDVVAFLDFDDELLAPRYRADEQALGLLARAARVVGGRTEKGRVLVQTRLDSHEVIDAALHADPGRLVPVTRARRQELGFPPFRAMAEISGAAAPAFIDALGAPIHLTIDGPSDGRWLVRASDTETLADALATVPRPQGRLRIEVDPLRV